MFFAGFRSSETYDDRYLATLIAKGDAAKLESHSPTDCVLAKDRGLLKGIRTVLDFGGGGGRHGFAEIDGAITAWAVVETPSMVLACSEQINHQVISYHESVANAQKEAGSFDLVHVSSSLQYTPNPLVFLEQLIALNPKRIIFEKLVVTGRHQPVRLSQYSFLADNLPDRNSVSNPLSVTRYGLIALPQKQVLSKLAERYEVRASWVDPVQSHLPRFKGLKQIGLILEARD